jgi:hypothetical protein
MLTVEASVFHLQSIILSETFCGKTAEAAENRQLFFFTFERFSTLCLLSHTLELKVEHNQGRSLLCACVQFQHYSLLCFGVSVDL